MEAICSLLLIRPPARKSDPATDHCRWREPALWAPAACLRAFSIPSKPWTRALVPAREHSFLTRAAGPAGLPLGFLPSGRPGDVAVRGRSATAVRCAVLCRAARAAAHGGSRGRVESRVGIGRPRRWNLPFVHFLGSLLAPGQPLPLSLRVIRLLFSFPPVPWPVGVACVWQPCDGRSMDRMALCVCRSKGASSCPGGMAWTQSLFLDTR